MKDSQYEATEESQDKVRRDAMKVMGFIRQFIEIHHDAPTIDMCVDGTGLGFGRARAAIAYLRDHERLRQHSLRPMPEEQR